MMDLGRIDLLWRSGVWTRFGELGYHPVVVAQTISYRRSLLPWQRFDLETRIVGLDERAVYLEQRFVVDGEIFAVGMVRGRFLKRSGGVMTIEEIVAGTGIEVTRLHPPAWVARWAQDVALPSTRQPAPSAWE